MRKTTSLVLVLATGGFLSVGVTAEAVDVAKGTIGDVEFIVDEDGTTPPLNPETPDITNPIIPGPDEVVDPTKGALRFDVISNFKFGTNKMIAVTQNYYAHFMKGTQPSKPTQTDFPHYVQVTDERGGTKGWEVSVKNDGIFTSGAQTFNGIISLNALTIHSGSGFSGPAIPKVVPTAAVSISDKQAHSLVLADGKQGQGSGTWTMPIGSEAVKTTGYGKDGTETIGTKVDATKVGRNPAVKLTVPQGQVIDAAKKYTTTIEWTLTDGL